MTSGTDYTVTWTDEDDQTVTELVNVGTYTATITGKGGYTGALTKTFTITRRSIADAGVTVADIAPQEWTGDAVRPTPTVSYNGQTLTRNTDYTVSYAGNEDECDDALVTIKGINNFNGSRTAVFTIYKAELTDASGNGYRFDGDATVTLTSIAKDARGRSASVPRRVNGRTVNALADGVFAAFTNATGGSIDLTAATGLDITEVDRSSGAFSGVGDGVLIYLPKGNTTVTGQNIVNTDADGSRSCESLLLQENVPFSALYDFTATATGYGRMLTASDVNTYTVCLPYDLVPPTGTKAYTLSRLSGDKTRIYFTSVNLMQAYKPYLLRVSESGVSVAPEGQVSIAATPVTDVNSSTLEDVNFCGTTVGYSNSDAAAGGYWILQAQNTWRQVRTTTPSGHVSAFRAYLQVSDLVTGSGDAPMLMVFDDEETDSATGISGVKATGQPSRIRVSDLQGRYVGDTLEGLDAGVYIVNGRKTVVK